MLSLLERKIGQLFFIGISGTEIKQENSELLKLVSPGGICFFARNIKNADQTRNFLNGIRELLTVEPLLSIDQEGGLVDRLRRLFTPMPAAAATKNADEVAQLAKITAEVLRILGFNMNFAPVVDVADALRLSHNNGLYSRTFGKSEATVSELALIYLKTLQRGDCLGCIKHFPGLGASRVDSHEELPVVNLSREELFATDLFPYREIFKSGQAHAVMAAHATYPRFDLQEKDADGKLLPSSLSFNIITRLLRREFGFEGLVISDDLEMGAILKNYSIGEACVMAINAGVDMLSICADADAIRLGYAAVLDAVQTGKISETRIEESSERIAKIKSLIQQPLMFDTARLQILSREIAELNTKVNYNYGG